MPQINPDKSFAQQPLRLNLATDVVIPETWLGELGDVVASILEMDAATKTAWLQRLAFQAGANSTYNLKAQLHEALKAIYANMVSPQTPQDKKASLAHKLHEGAANCTPGFHDRCNELVASFTTPENLDEALQEERQWIVVRARAKATDEVHANNRFTLVARNLGYGVRPLNEEDTYRGALTDEQIEEKLKAQFEQDFTLFRFLNSLIEQMQSIARERGYAGRNGDGYAFEDYQKFNDAFFKGFVDLNSSEFFVFLEESQCEVDEDGDVLMVPRVLDINWANVKKALLKRFIENQYFTFDQRESRLLVKMQSDSALSHINRLKAQSLFVSPDELIQALSFFKEWSVDRKADLVAYYLKQKSLDEKKALLAQLATFPDVTAKLQSMPSYQPIYLKMAAEAGEVEKVQALVGLGADINAELGALLATAKYETLWWLHKYPEMRDKITREGMACIISEGKHKGKTVQDVLLHSKKGCQLLRQDKRLQSLCPDQINDKSIEVYLNEKQAAIQLSQKGFFKPYIYPKVKQLLQHVVKGEMKEAEKLLKDNPNMQQELLTKVATVTDYAGRNIQGTALRIALGAKDVSIGEHKEMVEMLEHYMEALPGGKEEIAEQKEAQFPEGWEEEEKARKQADSAALKKVFKTIGKSKTEAEGEEAVNIFKAYLAKQKEKVVTTGFHFNEDLFVGALALYDKHYWGFGGTDSRKNRLAAIKVIGGIQCYFTSCLAQASCDGIGNVVDQKAKLKRSILLKGDPGYSFFHPELGRSHFVYSYNAEARLCGRFAVVQAGVMSSRCGVFQNLSRAKTASMHNFSANSVKRRRFAQ